MKLLQRQCCQFENIQKVQLVEWNFVLLWQKQHPIHIYSKWRPLKKNFTTELLIWSLTSQSPFKRIYILQNKTIPSSGWRTPHRYLSHSKQNIGIAFCTHSNGSTRMLVSCGKSFYCHHITIVKLAKQRRSCSFNAILSGIVVLELVLVAEYILLWWF